MKVDLTDHEVELILRALQEHAIHRQSQGLSNDEAHRLAAKLRQPQPPASPSAHQQQTEKKPARKRQKGG